MILLLLEITFADSLFQTGDYYRAIGEFKRQLFYDKEDIHAIVMIGESYYKLGDYRDALFWFGKAYFISGDRSIENKYIYLLGKSKRLEDLEILLEGREEHPLYRALKDYKKRGPVFYVSYVLPGGTQVLCGDYKNGALSFLWNVFTLYLGYKSIKEKDLIGIFFTISLFQRFYNGNLTSARNAFYRMKERRFLDALEEYNSFNSKKD